MSNKPYKGFEPNWLLTPAPENSYRSIFRWGDPNFFKYPKESLYTLSLIHISEPTRPY